VPNIYSTSTVYIRYWVQATVLGNQNYNPTSDTVQFAFTPSSAVAPSTWYSGSWETDTIGGTTAYIAKVLVGPSGTFVPAANTSYVVWIKVTDSPEIPVLQPGTLVVT